MLNVSENLSDINDRLTMLKGDLDILEHKLSAIKEFMYILKEMEDSVDTISAITKRLSSFLRPTIVKENSEKLFAQEHQRHP